MASKKTVVIYEKKDPKDATHVAIQTQTKTPYVWECYRTRHPHHLATAEYSQKLILLKVNLKSHIS
ncbi:MAG: hypothetical protein PHU12_02455 [Candidatus Aenigmarchaeota archaeon]|nr:hypothetical protein [Candidatus Aenigmarchaeota archaeon]